MPNTNESKPLNNVNELWGAAFDNGHPGSFVKELSELFTVGSAEEKMAIPFMEQLLSVNAETNVEVGPNHMETTAKKYAGDYPFLDSLMARDKAIKYVPNRENKFQPDFCCGCIDTRKIKLKLAGFLPGFYDEQIDRYMYYTNRVAQLKMRISNYHMFAMEREDHGDALKQLQSRRQMLVRLCAAMSDMYTLVDSSRDDLMSIGAPQHAKKVGIYRWYIAKDAQVMFMFHRLSNMLHDLATARVEDIKFSVQFERLMKFLAELETLGVWWKKELDDATALPFKVALLTLNLVTAIGQYVYNYSQGDDDSNSV